MLYCIRWGENLSGFTNELMKNYRYMLKCKSSLGKYSEIIFYLYLAVDIGITFFIGFLFPMN